MIFTFRFLKRQNFPLFVQWLNQPHVQRWWHEPATMKHVEDKYGPSVDGVAKTSIYIIVANTTPIGMIQTYWVRDFPDHVESAKMRDAIGLDLFIGEPTYIGKGYGSIIISTFVQDVIKNKYLDAVGIIADPSVNNPASIRTFEKAGFMKGDIVSGKDGLEQLMILRF